MKNSNELLQTVITTGKEIKPDLDRAFLEAVLEAEENFPDDEAEAERRILRALDELFKSKGI